MYKNDLDFLRMVYDLFAHGTKLTYAAMGVGLLVAFLYFRIFFRDTSGFSDDVRTSEKIPIIDKGYDYVESRWSSLKITIWIALSIGSGIAAYYQLPQLFPHWFKAP